MDRPRGDYVGSVYLQPDGKFNCNRLLDAAKAAATPAKVLGQEMGHGYGLDHASMRSTSRASLGLKWQFVVAVIMWQAARLSKAV